MFTSIGAILFGTGVIFAFLFAIYLFSIRINTGKGNASTGNDKKDSLSVEDDENLTKFPKKRKKKVKATALSHKKHPSETTTLEKHPLPEAQAKFEEEDDIIALASLKGYDTTGIRRSLPEFEKVKIPENSIVKVEEFFIVSKSEVSTTEVVQFSQDASSESVAIEEWSHVPTRDEEVIKNLKNKLIIIEAEIEESESKLIQNSRILEQSQKRINLLEQEVKEQRKLSTSTKTNLEAQIISLRAINNEMAGKLVAVEADAMNVSLLRNEFERSKEANLRLQTDLRRAQDEKSEFFRQLSELKTENGFLREQAFLADALSSKCVALEEELEEARRQMELKFETSQTELKLTRAKLESEIAFHRAEHANSVGSSTALHQEIAQLKSEIIGLIDLENKSKLKAEEFENLNLQLLKRIEESKDNFETEIQSRNNQISKLENDLETTKSKLLECEAKLSSESPEVLNLRNQLAEAEIKISSLRADLTREIKRADIAKKVYETKLAMFEKA